MPAVIQIDGWDPVTAAAVALRAASHDDAGVCHLDGQTWWPAIAKLPTLRYDLFAGDFDGKIGTPSSSLTLRAAPWPNFGRYSLADARIRIWTGPAGAAWAGYTLRFDGRVTEQPELEDGAAFITFAVDDRWLDQALLPTYAGTTGAEGPAAMKGQAKPLSLGAPRYVPGKLVDAVNSVFQVSAFTTASIDTALERLARFSPSLGDYPSYTALVAAAIPAGRWATANAAGMARFGAPPTGQVSFLLSGDNAGPDGWARKPGQLIRRLALLSGGAGRIDDASLNALDAARPYNLSIYVDQQTTARDLIQRIAASVNAVAGVSWTGQLFVAPVAIGGAAVTLAADGTALPPVASVRQLGIAAPWKKLALTAERTWAVHPLTDVAFTATLVDLGEYSAGATYREGNLVQHDRSTWIYIAPDPSAGHVPPSLPIEEDSWWRVFAAAGQDGTNGLTIAEVQVFQRAAAQPAVPTGGVYSFAAKSLTTVPAGWSVVPPAGTAPLWSAKATASIQGTTGTATPIWAGVGKIAQDGADGASTDAIFIRSVAQPATPAASAGTPAGWYTDAASVPVSGNPLWVSFGQRPNSAANYAWDMPARVEGVSGAAGLSVAEVTAYQRIAAQPATPTGGSYDFSAKVLTPPAGWSSTPPAGTNPLYEAKATVSVQGTTGLAVPTWIGVGKIAQDGAPGTNGAAGVDGAGVDIIFIRAAAQPATPAASTGAPAGWYTDVASVPASLLPLWSSFGQRANSATSYIWDTPARVEGANGGSVLWSPIGVKPPTVNGNTIINHPTQSTGDYDGGAVAPAMQGTASVSARRGNAGWLMIALDDDAVATNVAGTKYRMEVTPAGRPYCYDGATLIASTGVDGQIPVGSGIGMVRYEGLEVVFYAGTTVLHRVAVAAGLTFYPKIICYTATAVTIDAQAGFYADVTALNEHTVDGPRSVSIAANSSGVPIAPTSTYAYKRLVGAAQVTATWSIVSSTGCTVAVNSSGIVTRTGAVSLFAKFVVRSVYNGIPREVPVDISRDDAAPTYSTGSGGGTDTGSAGAGSVGSNTTSASYGSAGSESEFTCAAGSGGAVTLSGDVYYTVYSSVSSASEPGVGKLQWAPIGGTWTDVGSEYATDVNAFYNGSNGQQNVGDEGGGTISFSTSKTGLTSGVTYRFRFLARRGSSSGGVTGSFTGTISGQGS